MERKDIHILLAFVEIINFKTLNSCIVFCFDFNNIYDNALIFAMQ